MWRFCPLLIFALFSNVQTQDNAKPPEVYSLHAESRIVSRFATTRIVSQLANVENASREAIFVVQLPDAAFISNFSMDIDGDTIYGEVKDKKSAKEQFDKAKSKGQSAGLVAQAPRETNTFRISVNVAGMAKVTFNLTYQEMLQRVHGVYKHIVNVQPGQVVKDLKVEVLITEKHNITYVLVPEFSEKLGEKSNQELLKLEQAKGISIEEMLENDASFVHVIYEPNEKKQKELEKVKEKGLDGQLVVLYDVERDESAGEIQVVNGYFVHFFAPSNLTVVNKEVVFVLDTSGSMEGTKLSQTKDAMNVILDELDPGDRFNILEFSDEVYAFFDYISDEDYYDVSGEVISSFLPVTEGNVAKAKKFVNELEVRGGTNINGGLLHAISLLKDPFAQIKNPVLIFLTDGVPTSGYTTATNQILRNVQDRNPLGLVSIHCVAFGADADYDLLKKVSIQNGGVARRVYEDSDAALQLQGFYGEISSLLLSDVKIEYVNETVVPDSIITNGGTEYYLGSELMRVGKIDDSKLKSGHNFNAIARCYTYDAELPPPTFITSTTVCPPPPPGVYYSPSYYYNCVQTDDDLPPESVSGFVERMWAYLSIKKMLEKAKYDATDEESTELKEHALELSLKYNFVTELTSMVVTLPDEKNSQSELGEAKDTENQRDYDYHSSGKRGKIAPAAARPDYGDMDDDSYYMEEEAEEEEEEMYTKESASSSSEEEIYTTMEATSTSEAEENLSTTLRTPPTFRPRSRSTGRSRTTTIPSAYHTPPMPPTLPTDPPTTSTIPSTQPRSTIVPPVCDSNKTYSFYPQECEVGCSQIQVPNSKCLKLSCICKSGYRRDVDGRCVLPLDCSNVPKNCTDPNGEVTVCGEPCGPKTCDSVTRCSRCYPPSCICVDYKYSWEDCITGNLCGPPSCVCKKGYAKEDDSPSAKCVPESQCPLPPEPSDN